MSETLPSLSQYLAHPGIKTFNKATKDLQEKALEKYLALGGPPTKKWEKWRFTDFLGNLNFPFEEGRALEGRRPHHEETEQLKKLVGQEDLPLFFINGVLCAEISALKTLAKAGIEVKILGPETTDELLARSPEREESLYYLNLAQLQGGVVMNIPKGTVLDRPLHLIHFYGEDFKHQMSLPQHRIIVGDLAQVTFLESYASFHEFPYLVNEVTKIQLRPGARVFYGKINVEGPRAVNVAQSYVELEKDASLHSLALYLGGKLTRNIMDVTLLGEGAEVKLDGLYALRGVQQSDHVTCIDHKMPHTTSAQLYKGIMDNASRGTFSGKVVVRQGAQQISSAQLNKNLVLSKEAHADTEPQLEIAADDVKCSHGATIGQLSDEQLFYFASRGIPPKKVRALLTHGFIHDVILRVPNGGMQKRLAQLAYEHFEAFEDIDQEVIRES